MIFQTISAVLSGVLSGFILGLIGGGGSVLATPLLLYVVGVAEPHIALGTGALAVSVNAYANFIVHALRKHVVWRCAILFAVVGTVGALIGSSFGKMMNGQVLLFLFGIVMAIMGGLMLRPRLVSATTAPKLDLKLCVQAGTAALFTGTASGLFGIGGGFLIVPALILSTGMATLNAVGSSLLAVGTFGLATAINYSLSGLVDWRIAAEFLTGGLAGGIAGTSLAARLGKSKNTLNRIFAIVVFSVAVYVLYRSGREIWGQT